MNNFTLKETPIGGLFLIETRKFGDGRGFFMETWNDSSFRNVGLDLTFVQDNRSRSRKGTLRGLHFQRTRPQGKLVYVTRGEVFDAAVDLRRSSPTFGKWFGVCLNGDDGMLFYISPGFAHGFYVTSETADFTYKCTDFYTPSDEGGLLWNDPTVGVEWPIDNDSELIIAEKDKLYPTIENCFSFDF
jgi:dTDP-4-dehydrorhamnose 3,5-epimerase